MSKSETKKKVLQCRDRTERTPSDEEGMKVPLTALMHFKEGRSFTVSSPQREQNEMPTQDPYAAGESCHRAGFLCVLRKQQGSER